MKDIDKAQKSEKDERVVSQRRRLGLTTAAAVGVNTVMPKLITIEDVRPSSGSELQPSTNPTSSSTEEPVSRSGYDRHQSQLIIRTASRIGLHMLREDMVQDTQSSTGKPAPNHIQQEHFVINSCKVFIGLDSKEPLERGWFLLSPQQRQEILGSIQTSLPQEILKNPVPYLNFYNQPECTEAVKADAQRIVQTIASKKEMGILINDLPQAIGNLSCASFTLEQHIKVLLDCKAIIKAGVLASRYVVSQFISPWVIQSFRLLRSGKEKLVPFEESKASKYPRLGVSESRPEEENSSDHSDKSSAENPSASLECVKQKKKDHVSHGTESGPVEMAELTEVHLMEKSPSETSMKKKSQSETSQIVPTHSQESVTTRRKRRISSSGNHSAKRAKTIDTLGDE